MLSINKIPSTRNSNAIDFSYCNLFLFNFSKGSIARYKSKSKVLSECYQSTIKVQLKYYQSTIEALSKYYRSAIEALSKCYQSTIKSTISNKESNCIDVKNLHDQLFFKFSFLSVSHICFFPSNLSKVLSCMKPQKVLSKVLSFAYVVVVLLNKKKQTIKGRLMQNQKKSTEGWLDPSVQDSTDYAIGRSRLNSQINDFQSQLPFEFEGREKTQDRYKNVSDLKEKIFLYISDQANNKVLKISYQDLANEIGCGVSTVKRALYSLRDKHILKIQSCAGRSGVLLELNPAHELAHQNTPCEEPAQDLAQSALSKNELAHPENEPTNLAFPDLNQLRSHRDQMGSELTKHQSEPLQYLGEPALLNSRLDLAIKAYQEKIQKDALKKLGIKIEEGRGADFSISAKILEIITLLFFVVAVNLILARATGASFSALEKIPGVSGEFLYILIEAFIAYISFTLYKSHGLGFKIKILAILGLLSLSLALTIGGQISNLQKMSFRNSEVADQVIQLKSQINILDQRIESYLAKEWRSAALKLEEDKKDLVLQLNSLQSRKIQDETSILVTSNDSLQKQIILLVLLRVSLSLIGLFSCKQLGKKFSEIFLYLKNLDVKNGGVCGRTVLS